MPDFGITQWGEEVFFASKEVKIKDVEDIISSDRFVNREDISKIIAFDMLIANPDRNIGNFVPCINNIEPLADFHLYAIDFEKSRVLNPANILILDNPDEDYWPKGVLGARLDPEFGW